MKLVHHKYTVCDAGHSSRIRFLNVFFWKYKKRDFLRFFEAAFQKNVKKHNPKFEVSDFADFSLHGISTTVQNNVFL